MPSSLQVGGSCRSGTNGFNVKGFKVLVLTRKRNELVRIGDEVQVCIVDIRGDKVRLGIQAPDDVSVHREEVWQQIVAGGGHWQFAHLFRGQDYLGPTKCNTKRMAEQVVRTHSHLSQDNWGMVTASEDRPIVDIPGKPR